MARLPEYYNVGNREGLTVERLLEILEDIYKQLAVAINKKPDFYERETDGQASDTFLTNASININSLTNKVEMLVNRPTATTVTWKEL